MHTNRSPPTRHVAHPPTNTGCIRVDRIVEYLCEPLARALRDDDPYVRKTAAVCVAKLYDISPVRVFPALSACYCLLPL